MRGGLPVFARRRASRQAVTEPLDRSLSVEGCAQLRCETRWIGVQALPGDADHPPSGDDQRGVALAVGLEGGRIEMVLTAIKLNDQSLLTPDAIRRDELAGDLDSDIRLGQWEALAGEEATKAVLELPDSATTIEPAVESAAETSDAAAPAVALEHHAERNRIGELVLPHHLECLIKLIVSDNCS